MWQIYHSVVLCILCAVFAFIFFNSVVVITILILVLAGVIAFHDFPLNEFSFHVASLKCWIVTLYYCVLNMYNQNNQMNDNRMFNDSNGLSSNNIDLFNRKNTRKADYNLYTVKNDSQLSQTYNSPVTCSVNSSLFLMTKASNAPKSYGHNDVSISKSPKLHRRSLINSAKNDNSKNLQMPVTPLVSSSRYNATLDPKLYADVSSPGFCGRVAQKLSEAKTHQTKYGAVGMFPVVNLNKSPKHYLSPHNSQAVAKSPVRVRIAPPDSSYTSVNSGVFLNQADKPMKSVLQVLKEISRKRIHSEINDGDETVKRIRTEDYHEPMTPCSTESCGQVKRAREDSQPNCGEEIKRRRHFRNNEIHSSLSSSIKASSYNHGLKRKAYSSADDSSRSNSPVLGKLLKVQASSSTFVTPSLPPQTSLPVYIPVPEETTQEYKSTESTDTICKEVKENLQPLPQEASNELERKEIFEVDEIPINCKSQNSNDKTTGGRRFMGRDICLVNCGKAPVTEKPKREEKVVEESRLNLIPPINRQKRLTELLRAIDGYSEAIDTAIVDEKPQQEIIDSSKAEISPSGILSVPKLQTKAKNDKTVKSVSFSEPISVVKVIGNVADTPIPSHSGNSVSGVDSDSQTESMRIPSVLKVENPFTDKQGSPLNTGFTIPQFNLHSNPTQSTRSLLTSPFSNKTSPGIAPTTENTSNKVQTVTSSLVTVNTAKSTVDSTHISKTGGFNFNLKVDKKVTEKSTDLGNSEHEAVGKPFTFANTEDKNIVNKPLLFGHSDTKSNIENTLGIGPKLEIVKNMTFGATELKNVECTEEENGENVSTTIASKFCSPVSSLPSTFSPKSTFSSVSSSVVNNILNFKLPTSINQTSASDVLKPNSLTTKEETHLQDTAKSDSDVQKDKLSVPTTIIGNSSTDASVFKENETKSVSITGAHKNQSSQSNVNQTFILNSPIISASHSTQPFNNTFGSNSKTVFSMATDKKHSTNKESFDNIFMNSPNKDSTQAFSNIFNKDSSSASSTINIFGAITKEVQSKTDGVTSAFPNSNENVKNKTEIYTNTFVRNNILQQKVEVSQNFSSDKPVTNGFMFTPVSGTTVTKSGIFSNVFNTSQLQTTSNTTSSITSPKFTSNFGSFTVQSTTSSSNSTPTFSFASTSNTPITGSVFGNVPTNTFTVTNSGNASNFSELNQSNFNATESKAGFGVTSPFTFGSSNTTTSNFMFGNKQPTTVSETPVFGNSPFKSTDSKVFTFGGNSLNQTAGPASGIFTFGQTSGSATAQPVFQFNSGSNISSHPSAGTSAPPKSMFNIGTGSTAPRSKSVARSRRLK